MKKIAFLIIISFAAMSGYNAEAQAFGRYLEKKMKQAGNRAERKADEEVTDEMNEQVDKSVEKVFDNLFGNDEEADSSSRGSDAEGKRSDSGASGAISRAMMKSMGISMSPENVQESYHYDGNIKMNVQSWNDNGETDGEVNYTTHMSNKYTGFAMEFDKDDQRSVMIFDTKEGAMIVLNDDGNEKTGIVTAYAKDSLMDEEAAEYEEEDAEYMEDYSVYNDKLKKTGRSKKIAGYKSDEYRIEDEEYEGTVWLTTEISPDIWSKMLSTNVIAASNAGYFGGFVMEMDQRTIGSKERTYLQVQEVNEDQPTTISTKGYQLISFGGNMPSEDEENEQDKEE